MASTGREGTLDDGVVSTSGASTGGMDVVDTDDDTRRNESRSKMDRSISDE